MTPTKTRMRRNPPRSCRSKPSTGGVSISTKTKTETETTRSIKENESSADVDAYDPLAASYANAGAGSKEQKVCEFVVVVRDAQPEPPAGTKIVPSQEIVVPNEWPPLTEKMKADIDEVLEKPENYVLARSGLRVADLHDFTDGEWLNDTVKILLERKLRLCPSAEPPLSFQVCRFFTQIIDYYLFLISQRSEDTDELRSVYAVGTAIVKLLHRKRYQDLELDNDVNIFDFALIFFPIHISNHWRLVAVDLDSKIITAFDSLGISNLRSLNVIESFLVKEFKRVRGDDQSAEEYFTGWRKLNHKNTEQPLQHNNSDCGVFLLQFADHLARDKPFDFTQRHTSYFRRLMTYEVIEGKLLSHNVKENIENEGNGSGSDSDMDAECEGEDEGGQDGTDAEE